MSSECEDSDAGGEGGQSSARVNNGEPAREPSINTIFSVLAHPHRRYALDCLREHRLMTLADLADEVAVREYQRPLNEIPAETVKQVYLALYHKHIPKLETARLAEYDQAQDSMAVGEAIELVDPYLELVDDEVLKPV